MFHLNFEEPHYFTLSEDSKEFSQRVLFLEYFEEWERCHFHKFTQHTFKSFILADMYMFLHAENYETVQLYTDVLERYKIELNKYE